MADIEDVTFINHSPHLNIASSMSASAVPAYVINLDRSPSRIAKVKASADRYGVPVIRVAGVEGRAIDANRHSGIDVPRFEHANGRSLVPGEVGCYLSHVKALQAFLDDGAQVCLICEDDVEFTGETASLMASLAKRADWDVVKLFNFRYRGFLACYHLPDGWRIGRCLHGPLGSSAAYAVTRRGARRLLDALLPMSLPFDVALERGWKGDVAFYTTDRPAIRLQSDEPSTIVGQGGLVKYPAHQRLWTLAFRAREYVCRVYFAVYGAVSARQ